MNFKIILDELSLLYQELFPTYVVLLALLQVLLVPMALDRYEVELVKEAFLATFFPTRVLNPSILFFCLSKLPNWFPS